MKWFTKLLLVVLVFSPVVSGAQIGEQGIQPSSSIVLSPQNPKPNSSFTARVNVSASNLLTADIVWRINGVVLEEGNNKRQIELEAGDVGERMDITASLVPNLGPATTLRQIVVPASVDMIVEPQTHVPDFYRGRALPSTHSLVRATAILNTTASTQNVSYLWKLENQVLGGGPQKGTNSISFEVPLGRNMILSVTALNARGETIASENLLLPIVEPEVVFYEVNALKGTIEQPIDSLSLIGNETTIQAQPYNLDRRVFTGDLLLEWELDGVTVFPNALNPLEIIVQRNQSTGARSKLNFHIRNLDQLLQGAERSLRITY